MARSAGDNFSGKGSGARTTSSPPQPGGGLNAASQALNPNAEQWSARIEYLLRSITRKDMPASDVATITVSDPNTLKIIEELQDLYELFDPEFASLADNIVSIQNSTSFLALASDQISNNTAAINTKVAVTNAKLDTIITSLGTSSGEDFVALPLLPAATDLLAHRIVAINAANQYIYASNNDSVNVYRVAGVTIGDVLAGTQFSPRRETLVTNIAWNWNPAVPVYLGLSGALTQTVPGTGSHLLKVGDAITGKTVFFTIGDPQELL